ncbi:MAG: 50S ribosomal protein L35 [Planctomycetes bacterium ADurb.Bin126]|nr:MAG: 50S ribosomal protein L35 [Planctomycetes bacterium ADurb.Bin126]HOD84473.1 50S ribosomal protein L35 [Phycisphaerae bacterium]HQL75730.1 50S ribosomal protein L35 [Phycisphaerae bacterium]
MANGPKTRKSIAKRVKITARGKVMKYKPGSGHLKSRKSPKQLRSYRKPQTLNKSFEDQVKRMLGM